MLSVITPMMMFIMLFFVVAMLPLCRRTHLAVMLGMRFFVMVENHRSHLTAEN